MNVLEYIKPSKFRQSRENAWKEIHGQLSINAETVKLHNLKIIATYINRDKKGFNSIQSVDTFFLMKLFNRNRIDGMVTSSVTNVPCCTEGEHFLLELFKSRPLPIYILDKVYDLWTEAYPVLESVREFLGTDKRA